MTREMLYAARNLEVQADRKEREAAELRDRAKHIRQQALAPMQIQPVQETI